jgi:hypothetical protein
MSHVACATLRNVLGERLMYTSRALYSFVTGVLLCCVLAAAAAVCACSHCGPDRAEWV